MNQTDDSIRQLFNDLVDGELGPVRAAPAFDANRPRSGVLIGWRLPLLAAAVLALAVIGSMLAIDLSRQQRPVPAAVSPIPSALSWTTPSPVRSHGHGGIQALPSPGAYPDASTVKGVQIGPAPETASTRDGLITLANGPYLSLKDGKPHTVVLAYYPAPGETAVLVPSMEDVAQATCPPAFEVHAGHAYYISCTNVIVTPGLTPKFVLAVPFNTVGGGGFTTKANLY